MTELERDKEEQRSRLEQDYQAKLTDAMTRTSQEQAEKEKALIAKAEEAKAKALQEVQQKTEQALKMQLDEAEAAR